jgi:hypothetical protein
VKPSDGSCNKAGVSDRPSEKTFGLRRAAQSSLNAEIIRYQTADFSNGDGSPAKSRQKVSICQQLRRSP